MKYYTRSFNIWPSPLLFTFSLPLKINFCYFTNISLTPILNLCYTAASHQSSALHMVVLHVNTTLPVLPTLLFLSGVHVPILYVYFCPEDRFICSIFLNSTSVQFSCSGASESLQPHELQHARPPCPSPYPGVHSYTCPSSW